jgi:periplasmic protein TonB
LKFTPLQFSFGVSLAVHAVAVGVSAWGGMFARLPSGPRGDDPITLNLIAAPAVRSMPSITAALEPAAPATPRPPDRPSVRRARMQSAWPVQHKFVPDPEAQETVATVVTTSPADPEPTSMNAPPREPSSSGRESAPSEIEKSEPTHIGCYSSEGGRRPGEGAAPSDPEISFGNRPSRCGALARPGYLRNPEPAYPVEARRRRLEGLVLLEVRVSTQGRAVEIAVKQSSGYPVLDDAARAAVRTWEFEPARLGTLAIESRIEIPVCFSLSR